MTPEQQKEVWDFYQRNKNQQIHFPLDVTSKNVVHENLPVVMSITSAANSNSNGYVTVSINNRIYKLQTQA